PERIAGWVMHQDDRMKTPATAGVSFWRSVLERQARFQQKARLFKLDEIVLSIGTAERVPNTLFEFQCHPKGTIPCPLGHPLCACEKAQVEGNSLRREILLKQTRSPAFDSCHACCQVREFGAERAIDIHRVVNDDSTA